MDVSSVSASKMNTGSLDPEGKYQTLSNEELLEIDCDVLIPAA